MEKGKVVQKVRHLLCILPNLLLHIVHELQPEMTPEHRIRDNLIHGVAQLSLPLFKLQALLEHRIIIKAGHRVDYIVCSLVDCKWPPLQRILIKY